MDITVDDIDKHGRLIFVNNGIRVWFSFLTDFETFKLKIYDSK